MGNSNSNGQSVVELSLIMLILASVIFKARDLTLVAAKLFNSTQLSQGQR